MESKTNLTRLFMHDLGTRLIPILQAWQIDDACVLLEPVLAHKTPFPILGVLGKQIGLCSFKRLDPFLECLAAQRTMGGWVVIASALGQHLDKGLSGSLSRCRKYVIESGTWYGTDILGERVPGPALVSADFEQTVSLLEPWCTDKNPWVRRVVGVSVHFWAKHSHGCNELQARASQLLSLLEPMFEEYDTDAIKGVGWGLKTLGKYYPDLVSEWLTEQVMHKKRNPRMLMIRKATTYFGN